MESPHRGNQKYQCNGCQKYFTVGSKKYRQGVVNYTASHISLFKQINNDSALRRIETILNTSKTDIYRKIYLFYERCMLFALERENRNPNLKIDKMDLATDKQDYLVNWTNRRDRRPTQLSAIGTACKQPGYVFGMKLAFDANVDMTQVTESKEYKLDLGKKVPFQDFARIWTPDELMQNGESIFKDSNSIADEISLIVNSIDGDRSILEFMTANKIPTAGA